MRNNINLVEADLKRCADKETASNLSWFFKTGKGEYGENDRFLGIKVPILKKLAKKYNGLSLPEITILLKSSWHEERFLALQILRIKFEKADEKGKALIGKMYLKNTKYINNWDLVDSSALYILGPLFYKKPKTILYKLVHSSDLWERRIAVLTTFYFIRVGEFEDSIKMCKILLNDKHDLIHKAIGWMLREIGKRDIGVLRNFLDRYSSKMPRVSLRYAIERLSPLERRRYLFRAA
ncbi:MAG: DNA alkylation repair protein [Acidobacteriaceae bacterium]